MSTFEQEWARCAPWIEAALHRGGDTLTLDEVKARVLRLEMQFWPAPEGAVISQVIPPGQEFNILLAGGTMEQLEAMMPSLEQFAGNIGCTLITVLGRRGWERSFLTQRFAYKPVATLYGKALTAQTISK